MPKPTRAQLDQALTHLRFWHQHVNAAGTHHGRNQRLSDELLSLAIEHGARADALRGDLTWDEAMEFVYGGENDRS